MRAEDLYLSPSQATVWLEYKGKQVSVEPFYAISCKTQVSKGPSFGIFSRTFDYVPDGKVIVSGNLVLHYTSKLFLVHLFHKLVMQMDKVKLDDTDANKQKDILEKIIEDLNKIIDATRSSDPKAPNTGTMAILAGLDPAERSAIVKLLNARRFEYNGMSVDLNNSDYVATRSTPFGIEHINTEGLNLVVKFSKGKLMQNITIYDVHFVSSSISFSVSDNSPMVEVYQFVARI